MQSEPAVTLDALLHRQLKRLPLVSGWNGKAIV